MAVEQLGDGVMLAVSASMHRCAKRDRWLDAQLAALEGVRQMLGRESLIETSLGAIDARETAGTVRYVAGRI
jgi:hypothetical protein